MTGLDVLVNNVATQEPVDDEITPSYAFFASGRLSSYYSGQMLARRRGDAARVTAR